MARRTRSGAQFSPYEDIPHFTHRPLEVIQTDINLDDVFEQAIEYATQRAAYLDNLTMEYRAHLARTGMELPELDSDDEDWEDEDWEDLDPVASVPPSPSSSQPSSASASTASSRSTSPMPSSPPSPTASIPVPTTSASASTAAAAATTYHPTPAGESDDDDDDPEMPRLVGRVHRLRQDQPAGHPAVTGIHRRRRGDAATKRRKARCQAKAKASSPYEHQPKERHSQKHREQSPHRSALDAEELPASGGGSWLGARGKGRKGRRLWTLDELKREGDRVLEWNGKDPKLILDVHGRIIAVLVGTPEDPDWDQVIRDSLKEMKRARRRGARRGIFKAKDMRHRRGQYLPLVTGVSFGGGQQRPGNLVHSREYRRIVKQLLRNKSIRRIAGFQSSALAMYAPKLYRYYCKTLKGPRHLTAGPRSVAYDHLDFLNLAGGLCLLTVGGRFDHKKGAHLYLRQLKLIIESPSGASLLIPSACMNHGNTPLQPGETRCSITQYAAGGLFRWAEYGYQSGKALLSQPGGASLKAAVDGVPGSRWKAALELFSKYNELEADRAAVFGYKAS
ncbi:hypothetical protein C8J57DRAFT_1541288 [Mycena rebaudengoi]|nr:hypothetical protein C8J57DRAFT_1541288 [Mycena rebaudengoi]